jgi:hypothetical protein
MPLSAPMPADFAGLRSLFTANISAAPLASDSAHVVEHLNLQRKEYYGGVPAFNVWNYNAAVYTVGPEQPMRPIGFRDEQNKRYLPDIFVPPSGAVSLIPIPDGATAAAGTDGHLAVYQPSAAGGTLWELWRAKQDLAGAWSAVWGGRIDNVSLSDGFFPGFQGVSASGASMPASVIGIREAQAGVINHAIGLAVTRVEKGPQSWPARRNDGTFTTADAIHEGRRFRLDPTLDVTTLLGPPDWQGKQKPVHRLCMMIARAAQVYGFVITDTSYGLSMATESGQVAKQLTGVDPWTALLAGTPTYRVLEGFPWESMQALPFDWGKPTPV